MCMVFILFLHVCVTYVCMIENTTYIFILTTTTTNKRFQIYRKKCPWLSLAIISILCVYKIYTKAMETQHLYWCSFSFYWPPENCSPLMFFSSPKLWSMVFWWGHIFWGSKYTKKERRALPTLHLYVKQICSYFWWFAEHIFLFIFIPLVPCYALAMFY
jgi:hypothetical protein